MVGNGRDRELPWLVVVGRVPAWYQLATWYQGTNHPWRLHDTKKPLVNRRLPLDARLLLGRPCGTALTALCQHGGSMDDALCLRPSH